MPQSPVVDLSTSSAFLWQGPSEPPVDVLQWQPARVVLAEITHEIYGLVVCPVLDCGLAVHPPLPSVEMLIPETGSILKVDEETKRVSVKRVDETTGGNTIFHLHFTNKLEFWNFASTVAHLRSEEEERIENLLHKLSLVRHFVPSHGPDGLMDLICTNVDHAQDGDSSPRSSSSQSSSSTLTVTGV